MFFSNVSSFDDQGYHSFVQAVNTSTSQVQIETANITPIIKALVYFLSNMESVLNDFQKLMEQVSQIEQTCEVNIVKEYKLEFKHFEFLLTIEFIKIA